MHHKTNTTRLSALNTRRSAPKPKRHPMRSMTLSALLCATLAPTIASAQTTGAFPLTEGDGLTFSQVVFDTDAGPQLSSWGRVTLDPVRVSRILAEPSGFVNIHTAAGWVALNIPVQTDLRPSFPAVFDRTGATQAADLPVNFYFDLGSDRPQRRIKATVVFSLEPLLQPAQFEGL